MNMTKKQIQKMGLVWSTFTLLLTLIPTLSNAEVFPSGVSSAETRKVSTWEVLPDPNGINSTRALYKVLSDNTLELIQERVSPGVICGILHATTTTAGEEWRYIYDDKVAICKNVERVFIKLTFLSLEYCYWGTSEGINNLTPEWTPVLSFFTEIGGRPECEFTGNAPFNRTLMLDN